MAYTNVERQDGFQDQNQQNAQRSPIERGLGIISVLSPRMAVLVSALTAPNLELPTEIPEGGTAYGAVASKSPRLAQAISSYARDSILHGESLDIMIENACRTLFGLGPMTDGDQVAWEVQRVPGYQKLNPTQERMVELKKVQDQHAEDAKKGDQSKVDDDKKQLEADQQKVETNRVENQAKVSRVALGPNPATSQSTPTGPNPFMPA